MAERAQDWTGRIVRATGLIAGAMAGGMVALAALVLALAPGIAPGEALPAYGALVLTASVLVAGWIVPRQIAAGDVRRIAAGKNPFRSFRARGGLEVPEDAAAADLLYLAYFRAAVVALALVESGVLLNLLVYLLSRRWWSLAVAAVLWLALVAAFPTPRRIARWVDDHRSEIEAQALRV